MSLRAEFSTRVLKKDREGLKFIDMNEKGFLHYISKIINISAEQLKEPYIASDKTRLSVCAQMDRGIIGACSDALRVDDAEADLSEFCFKFFLMDLLEI